MTPCIASLYPLSILGAFTPTILDTFSVSVQAVSQSLTAMGPLLTVSHLGTFIVPVLLKACTIDGNH